MICINFPILSRSRTSVSLRGFTLIEVMGVVGTIAVLIGLAVGVGPGVAERSARLRADADLSVLMAALELYRRSFGDYPQTGSCPPAEGSRDNLGAASAEAKLLHALLGRLGPTLRGARHRAFVNPDRLMTVSGKPLAQVVLEGEWADAFADPWGRPYVYAYRASSAARWEADGYILYSRGPDGAHEAPVFGVFDPGAPTNEDNIHAVR